MSILRSGFFFLAGLLPAALFGQNTNPWPSTGWVGIGTASPQSTLDVRGTVNAAAFQLVNTSGGGFDNVIRSIHGTNNFDLIGNYKLTHL
jgi:hypothetical protein